MQENSVRILVIDDEEPILEAIELILEEEGYSITPRRDGKKGIRELEQHEFDLIICDIMMPDMDGIEFLRKMKSLNINKPVIIISGNQVGKQFLKSAELLGARATLQKPFLKQELLDAIAAGLKE